jgi:hypothetical protein
MSNTRAMIKEFLFKYFGMKRIFLSLFLFFSITLLYGQCDCEKIHREDGIITTCQTLPVCGDDLFQVGLSLADNGQEIFLTMTIRFLTDRELKISNDLSLMLINNNLLTFKLVKTQGSLIGNNIVEHGIFLVNEDQFIKIQNSKIRTLTIILNDNIMHTLELAFNNDVLVKQSKCLK